MREKLNCPNCGAVINAPVCPYCGSVFYDFANIEPTKPTYIRMKIEDKLFIFKAIASDVTIHAESDCETLYADSMPIKTIFQPRYSMDIHFDIVQDDRGVLLERYSKPEIKGMDLSKD